MSVCVRAVLIALLVFLAPTAARGQDSDRQVTWLPDRVLLPTPTAGPRDPLSGAALLYVSDNPTEFGAGLEAEFTLAVNFPILTWGEADGMPSDRRDWVLGLEAAAFARFGLHRTERELVNTDWFFTIPLVRWMGPHWARVRYYHTSSHLGDEYARRFEVQGENFARDALDALGYLHPTPALGLYGGGGWAFNVHPEDSKRWWLRTGVEWGTALPTGGETGPADDRGLDPDPANSWGPFASLDVNLDQDVGWTPRWYGQVGIQAPRFRGGRLLRFGLGLLSGPSPLGQFNGLSTRQVSLSLTYVP